MGRTRKDAEGKWTAAVAAASIDLLPSKRPSSFLAASNLQFCALLPIPGVCTRHPGHRHLSLQILTRIPTSHALSAESNKGLCCPSQGRGTLIQATAFALCGSYPTPIWDEISKKFQNNWVWTRTHRFLPITRSGQFLLPRLIFVLFTLLSCLLCSTPIGGTINIVYALDVHAARCQ